MYSSMNKEQNVFLVEAMEWVWNSKESQKVPKIRFFGHSIWQMVAQGNIFVIGKTLNFLACLSIFNMLSTFCLVLLPSIIATWNWGIQAIHYHNL